MTIASYGILKEQARAFQKSLEDFQIHHFIKQYNLNYKGARLFVKLFDNKKITLDQLNNLKRLIQRRCEKTFQQTEMGEGFQHG